MIGLVTFQHLIKHRDKGTVRQIVTQIGDSQTDSYTDRGQSDSYTETEGQAHSDRVAVRQLYKDGGKVRQLHRKSGMVGQPDRLIHKCMGTITQLPFHHLQLFFLLSSPDDIICL